MPVDPATLARARSFVAALRERGGTEKKPALEAALARATAPGFERPDVDPSSGAARSPTSATFAKWPRR